MNKIIKIFFLLVTLIVMTPIELYAQNIRVSGVVRGNNGERVAGVSITDLGRQRVLGITDDDGKYSIVLAPNATISFTCMGYSEKKEKVKGRVTIDVELQSTAKEMDEITVTASLVGNVVFEPSEIEILGNYFHLRTRFKVPKELMALDHRLVVQPTIYNVTRNSTMFLRPVVSDGREYLLTQERMYGFDIARDTLSPYIQKSEMSRQGEIIAYHDSVYIENNRDDYRSDVFLSVEDYHKIIRVDTMVIAKGTVNPLRFFDYNISAQDLTDSIYIPKPELALRSDKGEVHLTYLPGKSDIDETNPNNQQELKKLEDRIKFLEQDPDAKLQSMSIFGISSPEGNYAKNVELADLRMRSARNKILSYISPATKEFLKVESQSKVENWLPVVEMLKQDSLIEKANEVQEIINKYPTNLNSQFNKIKRLSYYRSIIVPYLTKLRRVEYDFGYSLYRILKDEEIVEMYEQNYTQLSRYDFYRMFQMAKDDVEKETLYSQAISVYPKFMLAANNLAALYIRQGRSNIDILKPFIQGDNIPEEVLTNQIIATLDKWQYSTADSLASLMPQSETAEYVKSITRLMNGNYQEALSQFEGEGGLNEVLILLAMKRNDEAWEKAQELPDDSARVLYVKAIITNRLDMVVEAIDYIETALDMDPSLREIAEIDADVKDLL
ncbi:MAG: carboxypeptidase-like regulatory domain-containing protein [Bacteroidales bacterium]|nr:carboxypeptidase-like regulatory domain-containing protein [Bacteroidales bacterium]